MLESLSKFARTIMMSIVTGENVTENTVQMMTMR